MSDFSNGLSDAELERLALLAEECAEVIQVVNKIIRHGYRSYHPDTGQSNRSSLHREIGDLKYAVDLMTTNGDLSAGTIKGRAHDKAVRAPKYLHHQGPFRYGN